jgi:hypothetical protein
MPPDGDGDGDGYRGRRGDGLEGEAVREGGRGRSRGGGRGRRGGRERRFVRHFDRRRVGAAGNE